MSRKCLWILIALSLSIPSAAHAQRRAGYDPLRMGHISYELGALGAQGQRDFNGNDTRTSTMGVVTVGMQFSLLHLMRESHSRLRITDYMRFDAAVGWTVQEQSDIRPGQELDLAGGGVDAYYTWGIGVQGSYLITGALEVGGVVAKGVWNDELTFDFGNIIRDTGTPWIRVGRIRYGHLLAELHTGSTPRSDWHIRQLVNKNDKFEHRDTYSSYRLRYAPGGRMMVLGIDFDLYEFQVYRDEPSELLGRMTNRSARSLRLVLGAMH